MIAPKLTDYEKRIQELNKFIKKPRLLLKDFTDLIELTTDDLQKCLDISNTYPGDLFWQRLVVRSTFSIIDSACYKLKELSSDLLTYPPFNCPLFSFQGPRGQHRSACTESCPESALSSNTVPGPWSPETPTDATEVRFARSQFSCADATTGSQHTKKPDILSRTLGMAGRQQLRLANTGENQLLAKKTGHIIANIPDLRSIVCQEV
jgi:hypothetical protein